MRTRATRAKVLAAAAALALAGAGCGGDDEDENGGGGGDRTTQPSRLAIELSGPARSPSFSVPRSVEGGVVRIEFTNSAKGDHSAQLVRAEQGHTPQEALRAGNAWGQGGKPLPEWAQVAGGIGVTPAGGTGSVTQELPPGRYLVADLESGANAEFEVTGTAGRGELPAGGGTIQATEYAFEARGLKAGRNPVLFENAGGEPHFVGAARLKPGKTLADARRFLETEKGESPVDESTGFDTAVIEGGDSQSVELDLEAGTYVMFCFVPDRKGGPPHAAKGMISEAVVGG
jgi:hypothetical protein